ncbi:MAG: hypothetical protein IKD70_01165, partial [Eggerthellaceae bacterium]|nr:hypothetical protein [Eggerthellaceae bacterium]
MKFGYDVIADLLAERFGAEASAYDEEREFGLPGLVQSVSDPTERDLLVVAASESERVAHKRGKLLILAGNDWPSGSVQGMRSPAILVRNARPETAFAELMDMFSQAIEWEMDIAEALERQSSIQ